jgi:hypothetical protein
MPFGCLVVAFRSKQMNTVDPKWSAGSKKGTFAGTSDHTGRHGYLIVGEDGDTVFTCLAIKGDKEYFPHRTAGTERIQNWNFQKPPNPDDHEEPADVPAEKPAASDDTEEYDFVNDARFKFGEVDASDIIDKKVVKDFVIQGKMVPCRGTCTGMSIDSASGETLINVVYDDGDEEDYSFAEFSKIMIQEESAFICGLIPDTEITLVAVSNDPNTVNSRREMLRRPDADKFLAAEKREIDNLHEKEVLEITDLPEGIKAIGSRFVYAIKVLEDGTKTERVRMVARGYEQQYGIDYVDTSAPVAGITGLRVLVVIALVQGWRTFSWDVTGAFLHPILKEKIFMKAPHGYPGMPEGKVFRLKKTLYGLKQSAMEWHGMLSGTF